MIFSTDRGYENRLKIGEALKYLEEYVDFEDLFNEMLIEEGGYIRINGISYPYGNIYQQVDPLNYNKELSKFKKDKLEDLREELIDIPLECEELIGDIYVIKISE